MMPHPTRRAERKRNECVRGNAFSLSLSPMGRLLSAMAIQTVSKYPRDGFYQTICGELTFKIGKELML
jgi:hypothetical protein